MITEIITAIAIAFKTLSFAQKAESISMQKQPKAKKITWAQMVKEINKAEYAGLSQGHNLMVTLSRKDGSLVQAKEPKIDAVFNVIKKCKKCKKIPMATE